MLLGQHSKESASGTTGTTVQGSHTLRDVHTSAPPVIDGQHTCGSLSMPSPQMVVALQGSPGGTGAGVVVVVGSVVVGSVVVGTGQPGLHVGGSDGLEGQQAKPGEAHVLSGLQHKAKSVIGTTGTRVQAAH